MFIESLKLPLAVGLFAALVGCENGNGNIDILAEMDIPEHDGLFIKYSEERLGLVLKQAGEITLSDSGELVEKIGTPIKSLKYRLNNCGMFELTVPEATKHYLLREGNPCNLPSAENANVFLL